MVSSLLFQSLWFSIVKILVDTTCSAPAPISSMVNKASDPLSEPPSPMPTLLSASASPTSWRKGIGNYYFLQLSIFKPTNLASTIAQPPPAWTPASRRGGCSPPVWELTTHHVLMILVLLQHLQWRNASWTKASYLSTWSSPSPSAASEGLCLSTPPLVCQHISPPLEAVLPIQAGLCGS